MYLSRELPSIGIECSCFGEKEFFSLGLAGYNDGKGVCTFLAAAKYAAGLSEGISMILTTQAVYDELSEQGAISDAYGICIVDNPRIAYFKLHNALCNNDDYMRPQYDTVIAPSASIHKMSCIAEKNVTIGENVVIEEFVSIKENVVIGDNTVIRAGSVIGGTGFEIKNSDGGLWTVTHIGGVIIGHDVEIQQSTTVDKAIYPWDNTILGDYDKINSQVQIAHGVKIGENTEVVSNVGIQGRVKIGKNVWIGPNSVIRNGISIGDNARVNMGAAVTLSVPDGCAVSGNFARPHETMIEEMKKYK
ncbi:MAG: UDP-3-O-(3-hydroxymyristoyl)glucosamine N-acyltransferase [Mogibacterium sp.]|nr:UDP-3-O-(3-hydroxymyristoyl)glucosamine N-acyltransferase [Mogibacterium sp.]